MDVLGKFARVSAGVLVALAAVWGVALALTKQSRANQRDERASRAPQTDDGPSRRPPKGTAAERKPASGREKRA
jgi:hypothetical protein